jgi:hypothetical protein
LAALGFSVCLACGERETGSVRGEAKAPAAEARHDPTGAASAAAALGAIDVSVRGDRLTIRSHAASRIAVLRELAAAADFSLEVGQLEHGNVTLVLEDVELEYALTRLLEGDAYSLYYAPDVSGGHVVALVEVGLPPGVASLSTDVYGEAGAREAGPESEAHGEGEDQLTPEQASRVTEKVLSTLMGSRAQRLDQTAGEAGQSVPGDLPVGRESGEDALARLTDPAPEVRLQAVEDVDLDGEGEARLIEVLHRDDDGGVRAAAAEQLVFADSERALHALVDALRDPDPRVVLNAVESLEMAADEAVIPDLEAIRDHPDAAVRQAVAEAIEFLE